MAKETTRKVDTGIIQRGKSYRFTVYMGYDADGKQIRKTQTFTPPDGMTQRKADKLAKEKYIEFRNKCKGILNLKENMKFSELAEEYFRLYAPNLKDSTAYNYRHVIDAHLMEYFGGRKLKDIFPAMITDFFASHRTVIRGELKPLSQSSAAQVRVVLQSLFSFAVSQEFIKESPVRNIIMPKPEEEPEEKRMYLTAEESLEFIELFQEYSPVNAAVLLMLYTGLRIGECLGLMWEDVDLDSRKIHIRHTLSNVGGKKTLTPPKTKTSMRTVFFNDFVYELLKKHRLEQRKLQLALGSGFAHPEMVFTAENGSYKDRSSLHRSLKRKLKGTKFEFMHAHLLRHTNATLLLNEGIDLKIVSEHLGHSQINVTANVYTAVLDDTRKAVADKIGAVLDEKTPDKHQIEKTG